jgi:hypothetical protein
LLIVQEDLNGIDESYDVLLDVAADIVSKV